MDSNIQTTIKNNEMAYETALQSIAARICGDKEIKLILIAGGSCAGKTTTTKKLSQLITECGRFAHTISLDDYYRNMDESVYLPDGTRDIESLNSLRVDLIRKTLSGLIEKHEASVPFYDFKSGVRTDDYRNIVLYEGDVVIIEGLHALDPRLFEIAPNESALYRIYLYADAGDGADCRLVRRLVRDSRHRGAGAEATFNLWDNVKANEYAAIEPFRMYADVTINTFFPYERGILNDDAVALLNTVEPDSEHYEVAKSLMKILESVSPIADIHVPENSLLREFM